jgi:hypothetical protein
MAEEKVAASKSPTFLEVKLQQHNLACLTDRHGVLWAIDLETGTGKKIKFEEKSET